MIQKLLIQEEVLLMRFEKISKYADDDGVIIPVRKTKGSAGYDFYVAEDIIVDSIGIERTCITEEVMRQGLGFPLTLDNMADVTKAANARTTLVPTGIKAQLDEGTYLELSVRSSCPMKYWLILANGVGIIDTDYYNNPDNEGHIFFQIINLSPYPILLKKGDCIGQGIIKSYLLADDDKTEGERTGGFGSTGA